MSTRSGVRWCPDSGNPRGRIARVLLVLLVLVLAAGAALLTGGRLVSLADNGLSGLHWLVAAADRPAARLGHRWHRRTRSACSARRSASRCSCARTSAAPVSPCSRWGSAANALVVVLNGAMPVSREALAQAGLRSFVEDPRHELSEPFHAAPLARRRRTGRSPLGRSGRQPRRPPDRGRRRSPPVRRPGRHRSRPDRLDPDVGRPRSGSRARPPGAVTPRPPGRTPRRSPARSTPSPSPATAPSPRRPAARTPARR